MESRNAILIHSNKEPGTAYEFEDNGVKLNFHCLPDAPADFEYSDVQLVGADGIVDIERSKEIRAAQEMRFRLKAVRG